MTAVPFSRLLESFSQLDPIELEPLRLAARNIQVTLFQVLTSSFPQLTQPYLEDDGTRTGIYAWNVRLVTWLANLPADVREKIETAMVLP